MSEMDEEVVGVSPHVLEQAKQVGQHLKLEVRKHTAEGRVEIRYVPINPEGKVDPSEAADQLYVVSKISAHN